MRGEINYIKRAQQILDFSGMLFDYKITPTDIDGCIEYRNKCFMFFEVKYKNDEGTAPLPFGQALALTRIIDNLNKPAVLFVASHTVGDCNKSINAAGCIIEKYYWKSKWYESTNSNTTLKAACDRFVKKYGENDNN